MKIGLINPNKVIKYPGIHIGLGYLASYAMKQDNTLHFQLLDTRIDSAKEQENFLNTKFDLLGITATSQVFDEALEISTKYNSNFPDVPICIGGAHVSTVKSDVLKHKPFDFAISGEGEETFYELIKYVKGKFDVNLITGLFYRNQLSEIVANPARAVIQNIDEIPFPAFELFKMNKYPQHRLTTSRGCPFNCVFCNSRSIWTNKWRKRSAQNIIDEITFLINKYGNKPFVFNDDSFNIDLKRVHEFCDKLIATKLNPIWSTSIRVDRIDEEIAKKMKASGCYCVSIGIESANNDVLKLMSKHITKEKIYDGIQLLRKTGIDVTGQFMIGNPGDTLQTIKESIDFANNSNLSGVEFYTALPYPDSDLYTFVMEHGKMLTDVDCSQYHKINPRVVYETPEFPYDDKIKAINLAIEAGYYHALLTDKKNWLFDFTKDFTKLVLKITGPKLGNNIYLFLRKIYNSFKN